MSIYTVVVLVRKKKTYKSKHVVCRSLSEYRCVSNVDTDQHAQQCSQISIYTVKFLSRHNLTNLEIRYVDHNQNHGHETNVGQDQHMQSRSLISIFRYE
jgi:hypothetical protein